MTDRFTRYDYALYLAVFLHSLLLAFLLISPPAPSAKKLVMAHAKEQPIMDAYAVISPHSSVNEKQPQEELRVEPLEHKEPEHEVKSQVTSPVQAQLLEQKKLDAEKTKALDLKRAKDEMLAQKKIHDAEVALQEEKKLALKKADDQKREEKKVAEQKVQDQKRDEKRIADQKAEEQKQNAKKIAEEKAEEQKQLAKKIAEQKAEEQKQREQKLAEQKERERAENAERERIAKIAKFQQQLRIAAQQAADQQKQAAQTAAQLAALDGVVDKYKALIVAAIGRQWIAPEDVLSSIQAKLAVRVASNGTVLSVNVVQSSGNAVLDRSATMAVYKASPLPVPENALAFERFRQINLTVHKEGVLS